LSQSETFPDNPFQPVSLIGVSDRFLGNGQTQSWFTKRITSCQYGKTMIGGFFCVFEYAIEISPAEKPGRFGKTQSTP
jgi:hypothetical protein